MKIRTAAVLGAGVMGAQIAALLATAGIKTYLFDLSKTIVAGSLAALEHLKPAPLGLALDAQAIMACDYHQDLPKLLECDFVIEAISERLDYKLTLYKQISAYIRSTAILSTNTAGLSIEALAQELAPALRTQFCGVHFFNPPRYMKLVEIIPSPYTAPSLLTILEKFLVTCLGKGVIYAKDTPGFIGNRIGVFSMLTCIHHAHQFNLTPDIVDSLMGAKIGRAKSAIFRTIDIVGLDVFRQAVVALRKALPMDPWQVYFCLPAWMNNLIDKGALGEKTKRGIYKKENEQIFVCQPQEDDYRPAKSKIDEQVAKILLIRSPQQRMEALRLSKAPQAQFLWACFRDLFHYVAYHFRSVAASPKDIDLALRWGYGWQEGPFEIWQKADWEAVLSWIEMDIQTRKSMATVSLPEWVYQCNQGVYEPVKLIYTATQRQVFPERILGEEQDEGQTIFETSAVRLWCHPADNIPILSFKTKNNIITEGVLEGIVEAVERAERDYNALVIWQRHGNDFSLGANLKVIRDLMLNSQYSVLESMIKKCQTTFMRVKYSGVPVVAALNGRVLAGGCELALHARSRLATLETYIGLVEMSVGFIPAGGGCKELAMKGMNAVYGYFQQMMRWDLSRSALEAKNKGYLELEDRIVMNHQELLYLAKKQAMCLADDSYYPPVSRLFPVAGRVGILRLQNKLNVLQQNHKIKDHEYFMGLQLANVLCGGPIEEHTLVDEQWILDLERQAFITLAKTECTQARIKYRLEKGQFLRN